ncbi:hypothetical protein [Pseudomonas sp. Q11]|uniref:hypothetical protein n=1 Tax=Pseudomonas sp. Q11 TaxID=2968470 RepID=UPI00210E29AA|nr:hypothetical protein [Pseudomonas sp. Q11]MCQ6255550.1 hypothetical protein [Pseudomonas sp. Q11]
MNAPDNNYSGIRADRPAYNQALNQNQRACSGFVSGGGYVAAANLDRQTGRGCKPASALLAGAGSAMTVLASYPRLFRSIEFDVDRVTALLTRVLDFLWIVGKGMVASMFLRHSSALHYCDVYLNRDA